MRSTLLEHDPQHLRHLRLRERSANTAADAAAEGQPRVRLGALLEEALRAELTWARIEVGTVVDERDPGIDTHTPQADPSQRPCAVP